MLLPADWHRPLLQRMVLLKDAGETAGAAIRGAERARLPMIEFEPQQGVRFV